MGLSNFPTPSEGVLPLLVVNTVLSVALLKSMVRSLLHWIVTSPISFDGNQEESGSGIIRITSSSRRRRRISITQFRALSGGVGAEASSTMECCVCLCGFQAEEEVSELSCKHFFHKGCLQKWFDNQHATCPLCRSIK
ncbi:unnamed protein product [Linum tenue]|uniref:RING-type domain-containing protein n=1 Tax=Linum tenue TaxID=586396 RepID=A0AAV0HZQ4_9ROSI|nr:unnamed protein product [Linum tenue]CAI0462436.1 unnamed protein product [Linum tenue]